MWTQAGWGCFLIPWKDFLPAASLHFKPPLELASPLLLPVLVTQNVFVRFPSRQECRGGMPAHGPNYFQTQQEDMSLSQKNKPESSPPALALCKPPWTEDRGGVG